jgi:hypothetical protein
MQPRTIDMENLALTDPVACLGILLGIDRIPFQVSMAGSFSTLAPSSGPPVQATFSQNAISQRTWVEEITYDLQVPNVFPNQIFKPQFDAMLKASPGIAVQLEVMAGPKYLISPDFTPLESVSHFLQSGKWPAGWPLRKYQTVNGLFLLTQSPGGAPSSQGPYNFVLTFSGWQFEDCRFDDMDPECARDKLREAGLLSTKKITWP